MRLEAGSKPVTKAVDGLYGISTGFGKFPANPANVAVNGSVRDDIVVGVSSGHQLVAGEHLAGIAHERADYAEFGEGEHHQLSIPPGLKTVRVHFQIAVSQDLSGGRFLR